VAGVLLLVGTFNLSEIVRAQSGTDLGLSSAVEFAEPTAPQLLGFFCYFVPRSRKQTAYRLTLAEAESELVAGFHTEYSSFKFAMFFMAELCQQ